MDDSQKVYFGTAAENIIRDIRKWTNKRELHYAPTSDYTRGMLAGFMIAASYSKDSFQYQSWNNEARFLANHYRKG
jgi:hypothetical protein